MRAGLSTRWSFCKCLVSAGAGLPTQRVGRRLPIVRRGHWRSSGVGDDLPFELFEFECRHCSEVGLHFFHLGADLSFELGSFSWRHRLEEESHPLHSCFGRFWRRRVWTISGVMSFLTALVTRPSYVGSILPLRGIGRLHGARSANC